MKLTPKQERFAQEVASGKSQADAYRAAFDVNVGTKPETIQQSACRLMADPKVSARVAELREPVVQKAQITLESHLADLQMLRDKAMESNQLSAAISAGTATAPMIWCATPSPTCGRARRRRWRCAR